MSSPIDFNFDDTTPDEIFNFDDSISVPEEQPTPTPKEEKNYDSLNTPLPPEEETKFTDWKAKNAPQDSGFDYDLRGAYLENFTPDKETGHWPDKYKKPNHPTFSDQSKFAKDYPELAGSWDGETYIPPKEVSKDMEPIYELLRDRKKADEKKQFPEELRNPEPKKENQSKGTYDYAKVGPIPESDKKSAESATRVAGEAITQSAEFAPQVTSGKAVYDMLLKTPVDALDALLPNAEGEESIPKKLVDKFYEATNLNSANIESDKIREGLKDLGLPQAKTKDEAIAGTVLSMAGGIVGPGAAVKAATIAEDIARSEKTAKFLKDESGMLKLPGQTPEPPKDQTTTIDQFATSSIVKTLAPKDTVSSLSTKADSLNTKIAQNTATPKDYTAVSQPNLTSSDIIDGYKVFENDPVQMAYYARNSATQVGDTTIDTYIREVKPEDPTLKEKVVGAIKGSPRAAKRAQTTTAMILNKFALARDLQRNAMFKDKDIYGPDYYVGRRDVLEATPQARIEVYHDTGKNAVRSMVYGKDDFVLVPQETPDGGMVNVKTPGIKSLHKSLDDAGAAEGGQRFSDLSEYLIAKDTIDQYNINNNRIVSLIQEERANPTDASIKRQIKDLQEYNYDMPLAEARKIAKAGDADKQFAQFLKENQDRNFLILDLMQRAGKLTPEDVIRIKEARPHYTPNGREWVVEDASLSDESFDNLFHFRTVNPQDVVKSRKGKNLTARINPIVAHEEYLNKTMNTIMKSNINNATLNFFLQLPDEQWGVFFREPKSQVLGALEKSANISPESAMLLRNKVFSITDPAKLPKSRDELIQRLTDFGVNERDQKLIISRLPEFENIIKEFRDKAVSNRSPMTREQARQELALALDAKIKTLATPTKRKIERTEIQPVEEGKSLSNDVVTFDIGGSKIQLTVNDGELFRFFQGSAPLSGNRGMINRFLSLFLSAIPRNLIVLNPEFSLFVGVKDTQDAVAFRNAASGLTDKLLRTATYPAGIANRLTYLAPEMRALHLKIADNLWGGNKYGEYLDRINDFKANYGAHSTFEGYRPESRLSQEKKTKYLEQGKYLKSPNIVYDGLTNIASRFDMMNRMWLYDNLTRRGVSQVEAQHLANNFGVNFVQEGIPITKKADGKTLRDATSTIYFLTAGINGLYRSVGLFRYEPLKAAGAIATVAAWYGAIDTWNQSQVNPKTNVPYIDELADDVKANNIIIYSPNAKDINDYYKFGIGYVVGPSAKNAVEAVKGIHSAATLQMSEDLKEFLNGGLPEVWQFEEFNTPEKRQAFIRDIKLSGKDTQDFARYAINAVGQTFSIPMTLGQYQPFLDIATGQQARTGNTLEGKGRYDYTASTSPTIKAGTDLYNDMFHANRSPKVTDTTIKGLTALAGKTFFDLSDHLFSAQLTGGELPQVTARDIPFVRGFRGNEGGSARTQVDMAYQNLSKSLFDPLAEDVAATKKNKDEARMLNLQKQYGREIELLKNKELIDNKINTLYQQKRRLMYPTEPGAQGEFGFTPQHELTGDPVLRDALNKIDEEITFYKRAFIENVLTTQSKNDIMKYAQHYHRAFSVNNTGPQYVPPSSNTSNDTVPSSNPSQGDASDLFNFR